MREHARKEAMETEPGEDNWKISEGPGRGQTERRAWDCL